MFLLAIPVIFEPAGSKTPPVEKKVIFLSNFPQIGSIATQLQKPSVQPADNLASNHALKEALKEAVD